MEQGHAGDGVAYFKSLFPLEYYDPDAGTETCVGAVNGDPYRHVTTSFGQTVYGGMLDVVTGLLTLTRKSADLSSQNWSMWADSTSGNHSFYFTLTDANSSPSAGEIDSICSTYKSVATRDLSTFVGTSGSKGEVCHVTDSNAFHFLNNNYLDANTFASNVTGTIVYDLQTPLTYQLTPQQISTLVGENNIWTDVGNIVVEYVPDTLYVTAAISAIVAPDKL